MMNGGQNKQTEKLKNSTSEKQNDSVDTDSRGPSIFIPPPLIVFCIILSGYGLGFLWPININLQWLPNLGILLFSIGCLLALFASQLFFRLKTSIEPWKPTSKVITQGIYRYSRNPIYLAFLFFQLGIGFYFIKFWIVLLTALTFWILDRFVVNKEEVYLQQKFGQEYLNYKKQVSKWI
ncbi:methyltransferase family protein [Aliikangiella maris]|uniref:Isoprenylcysteine carboxylmethyltransferase family protein n=2 Tax=Aliikangiella maris TaxID=3162458 RepID=A0ABV2BX21_9GAMM